MIDRSKIIYHWDLEQGSDEWREIRLGKFTGSTASVILTNGKSADGLGSGVSTLIYKNASELITGSEGDSFQGNAHTERGNACEPLALQMYEEATWSNVKRCGFIELNHYIGYSPDGVVGEDGLIECKSPDNKEYLRLFFERETLKQAAVDSKYIAQMQFGLWVTGRQWCDNIYFNAAFGAAPYFHIHFERDEKVMQIFDEKMEIISRKMDEIQQKYHDQK